MALCRQHPDFGPRIWVGGTCRGCLLWTTSDDCGAGAFFLDLLRPAFCLAFADPRGYPGQYYLPDSDGVCT